MTSDASTGLRGVLGTALVLALVAFALLRSHLGTRLDGFTVDEAWHIVAGVEYVRTGNFRLNPEHPPLAKLVVGATAPADFRLRPIAPLVEKTQERELVQAGAQPLDGVRRAQGLACPGLPARDSPGPAKP